MSVWDPRMTSYASVNPQNFHLVFTSEQLASSLQITTLSIPVLQRNLIMDAEKLHSDIQSHLQEDPISTEHLDKQSGPWTLDPDGLLRNSGQICSRLRKSSTPCSPILT